MRYDLTTIGEGQIRLTVDRGDRLSTCRALRVTPAGSEANVAGLLSQLGRRTAWASVLPEGDLATRFMEEYRSVGVDLSHVRRTPDGRMALYFMEPGESPLPARVTYDREHTAFRDITPDMFDWEALLDTRVVFITGITAALTRQTAAVIAHLAHRASAASVPVALDVNFRSLLWSADDARRVLEPLLAETTLLFCSRQDGINVFGIDPMADDPSQALRDRYGLAHVVSTDGVRAVYYCGVEGERVYPVQQVPVIDRPGAGDALVAGTLHGLLGEGVMKGVDYGIRASAHALTHFGDLTRLSATTLEESSSTDILR